MTCEPSWPGFLSRARRAGKNLLPRTRLAPNEKVKCDMQRTDCARTSCPAPTRMPKRAWMP
eukprot:5546728-Alexandrium_andersonii.AAC.1